MKKIICGRNGAKNGANKDDTRIPIDRKVAAMADGRAEGEGGGQMRSRPIMYSHEQNERRPTRPNNTAHSNCEIVLGYIYIYHNSLYAAYSDYMHAYCGVEFHRWLDAVYCYCHCLPTKSNIEFNISAYTISIMFSVFVLAQLIFPRFILFFALFLDCPLPFS